MSWTAALVDGFTQSSKTSKCFEILCTKVQKDTSTLVLFVTQANSISSVQQTLQRAQTHEHMLQTIPKDNMISCTGTVSISESNKNNENWMLVGFWHSKTKKNMMSFVCGGTPWKHVIIVIDETEQGGEKGVKERLDFVADVEAVVPSTKIIFVTATVANLSKSIAKLSSSPSALVGVGNSRLVQSIVHTPTIEHHFVKPTDAYVGPSWFMNATTPSGAPVWKRLVFPQRPEGATRQAYQDIKTDVICGEIKALPESAKELCLVVTSVKVEEHKSMAMKMFDLGFNVIVELNGANEKNYAVTFVGKGGTLKTWQLPYTLVETLADNGSLSSYRSGYEKRVVESGIHHRSQITLPLMLQAGIFMSTTAEDRIRSRISPNEFAKLEAVSCALCNTIPASRRRPFDYPEDGPRVAIIAGHLAGRGITIQNPAIDFTCSSFCFVDTKDKAQRGATNAQRFGRACGMLKEIFTTSGRTPFLIATEAIVKDAVSNEEVLREKAVKITNGELICLKDLISKRDWERIVKTTRQDLAKIVVPAISNTTSIDNNITGKKKSRLIEEYRKLSCNGTKPFTFDDIRKNPVCCEINKSNNRVIHKMLVDQGVISKVGDKTFVFCL